MVATKRRGGEAPGQFTPTSDKADGVTSAIGPKTHENQHYGLAADGDKVKAFTTMQAQAARCGCMLQELSGGGYLLTRTGLAKKRPEIRAVSALLRCIGGAA